MIYLEGLQATYKILVHTFKELKQRIPEIAGDQEINFKDTHNTCSRDISKRFPCGGVRAAAAMLSARQQRYSEFRARSGISARLYDNSPLYINPFSSKAE